MSRTLKTSSRRKYFKNYWQQDRVMVEGYGWRLSKTTKPKLKKVVDTEDHWMTTPQWWVRIMMNKPERRATKVCLEKLSLSNLEEVDIVDTGRKPHVYYW